MALPPLNALDPVIVIDDDPSVASAISATALPHPIIAAYNGADGLDRVRERHGRVSLVVLDVRMPHDGIYTCIQLRTEYPSVRILPYTAAPDHLGTLADLGCLPPVLKPAPPELLRDALVRAIGGHTTGMPMRDLPVWSYLREQAQQSEQALRERRLPLQAALLASSTPLLVALHTVVSAAGVGIREQTTSPRVIQATLRRLPLRVLIADHYSAPAVLDLKLSSRSLPLLLVVFNPWEGYRWAQRLESEHVPGGVIINPVEPSDVSRALLAIIDNPSLYIDPRMDMALHDFPESERRVARLVIAGLSNSEITRACALKPQTVRLYRSHIYARAGMIETDGATPDSYLERFREWVTERILRLPHG